MTPITQIGIDMTISELIAVLQQLDGNLSVSMTVNKANSQPIRSDELLAVTTDGMLVFVRK